MSFDIRDGILYKYTGNDAVVFVPPGVKTIFSNAFRSNNNIQTIIFPIGVESLGSNAISFCNGLKQLFFPDTIKRAADDSFSCSTLEELHFPSIKAWLNCPLIIKNYKSSLYIDRKNLKEN